MTIKVLLLKSGEDIIADVQEMVVGEDEERRVIGYFLSKPCVVKLRTAATLSEDEVDPQKPEKKSELLISMYPWMPLAREKTIPVPSDWVVTMVTPVEKLFELYEKDVLKNDTESDKDISVNEQSDSDQSD